VEFPSDLFNEEIPDSFDPTPVPTVRYGPDSASIEAAVEALLDAECPVIYAGQGVHYAQAWDSLKV
jgi:acetolactate synthase-1/2/3 large subunit